MNVNTENEHILVCLSSSPSNFSRKTEERNRKRDKISRKTENKNREREKKRFPDYSFLFVYDLQ